MDHPRPPSSSCSSLASLRSPSPAQGPPCPSSAPWTLPAMAPRRGSFLSGLVLFATFLALCQVHQAFVAAPRAPATREARALAAAAGVLGLAAGPVLAGGSSPYDERQQEAANVFVGLVVFGLFAGVTISVALNKLYTDGAVEKPDNTPKAVDDKII
ncbi:unnamed protein product [Prorocentrum cordatum]|uniref:Uncharacterized protein n=1 Tax=Prorocentrum cordatum TaxID=2364126 RepID=A0ABN9SA80_9DINO|nr:unnamed protein product [Polarella glacialis]